jgi:hypothetical protein
MIFVGFNKDMPGSDADREWVGRAGGWTGGWSVPAALVSALLIGYVASWRININRFSLHALYRNRIIRAFLGASNTTRSHAQSFHGF